MKCPNEMNYGACKVIGCGFTHTVKRDSHIDYVLKVQSRDKRVDEIMAIFDKAIFPSKEEEDSIEHVDMGLKEFNDLLKELAELAKQ